MSKEPKRNPFKQWLDEQELRTFISDCVKTFEIKDIDFSDHKLVQTLVGDILSNDDLQTALRNMVGDFMGEFLEGMKISVTDFRGETWKVGDES